jgi:hypothetical protein
MSLQVFGYETPAAHGFELAEDDVAEFELRLSASPTAELSGDVRTPQGQGIAASIRLAGVPVAPVQADADGHFVLSVPAGRYDLVISAFGFATQTVAQVEIPGANLEVELEKLPDVLLIDDDGVKPYEQTYQESLESLGIDYLLRPVEEITKNEDLYPHKVVIWNVGNRSSNVFPVPHQALVKAYLKAGGQLIVSGQDVGYGLKTEGFLPEILGANFVTDTAATKQVEGQGLDFPIDQQWPDVLSAVSGASLWLRYQGGEGAAVVHDVLGGRVVYLGFGFEGVADLAHRNALLQACFSASDQAGIRRRELSADWFGR